jgi:hypothetical protein
MTLHAQSVRAFLSQLETRGWRLAQPPAEVMRRIFER